MVPAGKTEDETNHLVAVEGTQADAPIVIHGDEVGRRDDFDLGETPDIELKLGASLVFRKRLEASDFDAHAADHTARM